MVKTLRFLLAFFVKKPKNAIKTNTMLKGWNCHQKNNCSRKAWKLSLNFGTDTRYKKTPGSRYHDTVYWLCFCLPSFIPCELDPKKLKNHGLLINSNILNLFYLKYLKKMMSHLKGLLQGLQAYYLPLGTLETCMTCP